MKIMSTSDTVQDKNLLPGYTVKSWKKLLSFTTNMLKSSNSSWYRGKPKHLEVDSATGLCRGDTTDQC